MQISAVSFVVVGIGQTLSLELVLYNYVDTFLIKVE